MHNIGSVVTGSGAADNDVLVTLDDVSSYDTFMVVSTVGAVDVEVSLNGTDWFGPISMADMGATVSDPVIVTEANRLYGFRGKYRAVRVLQNGATAATAQLRYGVM